MTKTKRSYDIMYPLGVTQTAEGVEILMPYEGETMELLLFHAGEQDPFEKILFNKEDRIGEVWIMSLPGYDLSGLEYSFLADGKPFSDPYARSVTGREQWGELRVRPVRAHIPSDPFDWQGDKNPEIPYSETILYRLHEVIDTYGHALKDLIHEQGGNAIMSAIDFGLDCDVIVDDDGNQRVIITLDGKLLPYAKKGQYPW